MSNQFSKEERVAFEEILEGFNDALVLSRNVSIFNTDSTTMERTNNTLWRPMPYVARSWDGMDQTANFLNQTQLSVPATIGFRRSSPWIMDALELRDALQERRLGDAARQKLASDVNVAVMNVAAAQGTLVVRRTGAATGFDDIAAADAMMNEIGVQMFDRTMALSSRDYMAMAGNLAARQTVTGKVETAYERAHIGVIAGFDTFKLDYANRQLAAAGGALTVNTQAGANHYVPIATRTAVTGEVGNVDNRTQTITVATSTANVRAGDAFTIDGVNSVHLITKADTGQRKTFRVIAVPSGTTLTISPPIISNLSVGDAAAQYQNCVVAGTGLAAAAITWLNTAAAAINPFWQKDAIELLPGRYAVPGDAGAGVMRATTENGIELVMQKQYDIQTMRTRFRMDCAFGVVNKQPEMTGIMLFGQT